MKLFLTGGNEVAAALGFEKLEREREWSSGVKEVRKGEGVFIVTVKKLFARRFRTNVPLTLLIHLTCVTATSQACVGFPRRGGGDAAQ